MAPLAENQKPKATPSPPILPRLARRSGHSRSGKRDGAIAGRVTACEAIQTCPQWGAADSASTMSKP